MIEQLISIKVVLDKLHRHPLLTDVSLETAVDYCVDFMRIVGVPQIFLNKVVILTLADYKLAVPTDFIDLVQIRYNGCPLRSSTDLFHLSTDKTYKSEDDTFIIQGGYIHSTVEKGDIELSYRAIATDDIGMPMLPDNSDFTRALEAYIKVQHFSILFDLGKIQGAVLQKAQQDYAWAVGACETEAHRLDLSKAESLFNSWRTLVIRDNEFNNSFRNNGVKQVLLNH